MARDFFSGSSISAKAFTFALALTLFSNVSVAGDIPIVGTGDGMDVLQAAATVFNADNAGTKILVPPSIGSGGGIAAVGTDQNILGRIARPLSDKEKAQGIIYTPVMQIPSAIFAHPSAGVTALTNAQLRAIFEGSVASWKEVGGADIRIRVVRREDADSTLAVLRATMPGWKDIVLTTRSKTATTTQEMVDTVQFTEGAIGFGPYGRALASAVSVISIDGKKPVDAGYPSAVVVALIHKEATATPEAKSFIEFMKSPKARSVLSTLGASSN
jgi:phosphate transport system substrate-binding protein